MRHLIAIFCFLHVWAGTAYAQSGYDLFNALIDGVLQPDRTVNSRSPRRGIQRRASDLTTAEMRRLQSALKALGYYAIAIDGKDGPGTRNAVARWAQDRGWDAPSTLRLAHVESMENEISNRGLAIAQQSPSTGDPLVRRVQTALQRLGYYQGAINGHFGPAINRAVAAWARDRGWSPPETLRVAHADHMENEAANKPAAYTSWVMKKTINEGSYAENCVDKTRNICVSVVCDPGNGLALKLSSYSGRLERASSATLNAGALFTKVLPIYEIGSVTAMTPLEWSQFTAAAHEARGFELKLDHQSYLFGSGQTVVSLRWMAGVCSPLIAKWTSGADPFSGKFWRMENESAVELISTANARGELEDAAPPATRGFGPIIDKHVTWLATDNLTAYQQRIRTAAKRVGGECTAEQNILAEVSRKLRFAVDRFDTAQVGHSSTVNWSSNELVDRIPAWIVVSTDKPVRFGGRGHVALGPEAANPFGIQFGLGRHRALVALASRGAGETGAIDIEPLLEGVTRVTFSVVGYLRACEEEILLREFERDLVVRPGQAAIVLNTVDGRSGYTHSIEVPKFQRTILINDTRFLVLDSRTGAEIIERPGKDLKISPTHRFIDVGEIVDILDGKVVAPVGATYWAAGDSFVISGSAPWGKVSIYSTFGNYLQVSDQLTGPACCEPKVGETRIGIDLENAIFSIWGTLGYRIGPLQNDRIQLAELASGGYASDKLGNSSLYHSYIATLGPVSPVSFEKAFDAAGGFFASAQDPFDPYKPELSFDEKLRKRMAHVGLQADTWQLQSAVGANSRPVNQIAEEQFRRLGIETTPMLLGETLLGSLASRPDIPEIERFSGGVNDRIDRASSVMNDFASEALGNGWQIEWSLPDSGYTIDDCYHLGLAIEDQDGKELAGVLLAPRDVNVVNRVATKKGAVWIAQAQCQAGATFGTLRDVSALYLMDLGNERPSKSNSFLIKETYYTQNTGKWDWFDGDMKIKANDEFVLTYAPNAGAISLWNREKREFTFIGENVPGGELLSEAWLLEGSQHIVQLNSDGNLFFHRVHGDQAPVLYGRIVDDEIAVWTADFRYDATAEAQALIDLKFPGHDNQYSLDRFGAARRIEDLARFALGELAPLPAAPDIRVPPRLSGSATVTRDGNVVVTLDFDPARVVQVLIFQDGVQTGSKAVTEISVSRELHFQRLKDSKEASIFAIDKDGLVSAPVMVRFPGAAAVASRKRALVVGINTYTDPRLRSLDYPLQDAERVLRALNGPNGDRLDQIVLPPKDRNASPAAILDAVDELLQGLEAGDHAVVYFAGHGLRGETGEFYLATSQTDTHDLLDTALPFSHIRDRLAQSSARITIILDTCHSGAAGEGIFATSDDAVIELAKVPSNLTILAASKGRQLSLESSKWGGGLFSVAIANVIGPAREKYDIDQSGSLEASEFYRGVKEAVVEASSGEQTPWMVRSRMVGDYALF
ncbi:peptidoglycan-binding protein [Stappia sp. P2PMeth1]|uniref:peptidoglycan-binding protein n=1 Tax=Stappia sp. P2PMeth1 TaxID=2003586 RepID=UPI001646B883|nr:peptidoglycan-binding protein [Stappia sp. P2PMeth1]